MTFQAGERVCCGPYCGSVFSYPGPNTIAVVLDSGKIVNMHVSVMERENEMARPKKSDEDKARDKAAREAAKSSANDLFEAVKFCAPGFKEGGEPYSTHAMIYGGWLTTYTGVIMFGHPIAGTMQALPHFGKLLAALKATDGKAITIAQLSMDKLSIKGASFRGVVPCLIDPTLVARHAPDPAISMLDSRMRDGFTAIKSIASKTGEHVLTSSVLVRNGEMIATDTKLLAKYTHGIGFPTLTVPADFIEAVLKVPKQLVSFGYTEKQSLTFYFEDGSFIRTQLYSEEWPDVDSVWPADWNTMRPVPPAFFAALAQLQSFSENNTVICDDNIMRTHDGEDQGATVDVPGLVESEGGLDISRLLRFKDIVTHIDYFSDERKSFFVGPNLQGVCVNFQFTDRGGDVPADLPKGEPPYPMPEPVQAAPEAPAGAQVQAEAAPVATGQEWRPPAPADEGEDDEAGDDATGAYTQAMTEEYSQAQQPPAAGVAADLERMFPFGSAVDYLHTDGVTYTGAVSGYDPGTSVVVVEFGDGIGTQNMPMGSLKRKLVPPAPPANNGFTVPKA